jgi:phenylpropionate dioxygenase-like ring-hydroxylating dioxygenase large terminal subunit
MKPLVFPESYREESVFKKDLEMLKDSCWIFAGLTSDLAEHQDYVVVPVGNLSVVVQNFKGKLKAFKNVCTHRYSIIQTEPRGNRPLMCPYHGWNFDENGSPIGIPKKPHFGDLDDCTMESLLLSPWQVTSVGAFVFIASENVTVGLSDYLGSYRTFLEKISEGFGMELDCNELDLECDWKVAVENTLESYHVSSVHPTSFYRLGPSGENFTFDMQHSDWLTSLNEKTTAQTDKISHLFESRPFRVDGYKHVFIFPNLTIATTLGTSFSIQRFDAVKSGRSHFTSWVYATKRDELKKSEEMMVKALNKAVVDFNRKVFMEDKVVCKQVQRGIDIADCEGLLSDIEDRVYSFQEEYTKVVNK